MLFVSLLCKNINCFKVDLVWPVGTFQLHFTAASSHSTIHRNKEFYLLHNTAWKICEFGVYSHPLFSVFGQHAVMLCIIHFKNEKIRTKKPWNWDKFCPVYFQAYIPWTGMYKTCEITLFMCFMLRLFKLYVIIMSRTSFTVILHSITCVNVKELLPKSWCHI